MWISRREYERWIAKTGQTDAVQARCGALQATNEWLMHRLTQLEHERAKLIETYMGVKIPVPEVGTAAPRENIDQVLRNPGDLFSDMGDEEAERLGVDWDAKGELTYGNRK